MVASRVDQRVDQKDAERVAQMAEKLVDMWAA